AEGNLLAVCLQHEIDHLAGVTMLDHLSPADRVKAIATYNDALAAGARPGDTASDME
ncbi:MAG: peptide deformylase, partial [Atopobiaceae bacterium]|nr:peptide deformylase [Atopobiaceae bacterium]